MKLLIVTIIILAVSQSIKFLIFLYKGGKITKDSVFWNYIWIGKFPSTHAAILGGVLYTVWHEEGISLFFGFCTVISALFIYMLIENKKRYKILETYFSKSNDHAIQSIISDNKLNEFEGHTAREIIVGLVLGITLAIVVLGVMG